MNRFTLPMAFTCLLGCIIAVDAQQPQLAHMVFFKLRDKTAENRQSLIAACEKHLSGHPGTVYFSAAARADELQRDVNDREFDVALHLVFANRQAHDKYQVHPRHLQFIKENKQAWSDVRVFDSIVPESANGSSSATKAMLASKLTVEFDRLSLIAAVAEVQRQYTKTHKRGPALRIAIVGADLQREGITINQRVSEFSQRESTLADVLTKLVMMANPLRGVRSPSDPDQKLVWVVNPADGSILITTRRAAKANSHRLPRAFETK